MSTLSIVGPRVSRVAALAATLAFVMTFTLRGAPAGTDTSAGKIPSSSSPAPAAPEASPTSPEVEIEAKFIEMTRSSLLALDESMPGTSPAASVIHGLSGWYTAQSSAAPNGFFRSSPISPDDFGSLVRQLNLIKGVDLLSSPRVITQSGLKAAVEIVREFAYATAFDRGQDPAGRPQVKPTKFDKTNTGLSLEVNPVVASRRDVIDLSLDWKVTDFEGFVGEDGKPSLAPSGDVRYPVFNTRAVNTVVSLSPNATVVFGLVGLRQTSAEEERAGVPKKADDERLQLIFVTARLVAPPAVSPAPPDGGQPAASRIKEANKASASPADTPFGVPVSGKPGFVTSPYAADAGFVDVHGFSRGQLVRDPFTNKVFRMP